MSFLSGGGSSLYIYQIKKVAGVWTVVQGGTETAATGTGDALIHMDKIEQTQLQPQDDGTLNINLDQYKDDSQFSTFLKNYVWKAGAAATALPKITLENGIVQGGSSASGMFLAVSHGPVHPTDGRKVHVGVGSVAKSSGGSTFKADSYTKPGWSFVGSTIDDDLEIVKALFDAALVDTATATDQTLEGGLGHDIFWLPPAS